MSEHHCASEVNTNYLLTVNKQENGIDHESQDLSTVYGLLMNSWGVHN